MAAPPAAAPTTGLFAEVRRLSVTPGTVGCSKLYVVLGKTISVQWCRGAKPTQAVLTLTMEPAPGTLSRGIPPATGQVQLLLYQQDPEEAVESQEGVRRPLACIPYRSPPISRVPCDPVKCTVEGPVRVPIPLWLHVSLRLGAHVPGGLPCAPLPQGGYRGQVLGPAAGLLEQECPICTYLLREPVELPCCGFMACGSCLRACREPRCPHCRTHFRVTDASTFPPYSRLRQRSILALTIACPNAPDGCPWTGTVADAYSATGHVAQACAYTCHECPLDCGAKVPNKDIVLHCLEACEQRVILCPVPGCGKRVVQRQLGNHILTPKHMRLCMDAIKALQEEVATLRRAQEQLQQRLQSAEAKAEAESGASWETEPVHGSSKHKAKRARNEVEGAL